MPIGVCLYNSLGRHLYKGFDNIWASVDRGGEMAFYHLFDQAEIKVVDYFFTVTTQILKYGRDVNVNLEVDHTYLPHMNTIKLTLSACDLKKVSLFFF